MPKKDSSKKVAKRAAKKSTVKAAKKVANETSPPDDAEAPVAKKISARKSARRKKSGAELTTVSPPVDLVAQTAYLIYLDRLANNLPGDEQSDWLAAEESLRVA
jgi:hypothetical protein